MEQLSKVNRYTGLLLKCQGDEELYARIEKSDLV